MGYHGTSSPGFRPPTEPEPEDSRNITIKRATLHFDSDRKSCYFGRSISELPNAQRYRVPDAETGSVVEYSLSRQAEQLLLYDAGCSIKPPLYTTVGSIGGGFFGLAAGGLFEDFIKIQKPNAGAFCLSGLIGGAVLGGGYGIWNSHRTC